MKTILSIEDALKAANDGQNQDIKGQFVSKHVYCNVNTMVEYIICQSYEFNDVPFSCDDIENYYSYPEYQGEYAKFEGGSDNDRDTEIERLKDLLSDLYDTITEDNEAIVEAQRDEISEEIEALENLDQEQAEIYEYWAISEHLYNKLNDAGYCVLDAGSCYVWGRTTTGQAILLDYVISKICADMGILEGQENSWAK